MDGSFLTYIDYIQLFHKKNKPLGNFFKHMFNKILPYKFILGKKILSDRYSYIFNVIDTKLYEVVFYVHMICEFLIVYDLKKDKEIKVIFVPWNHKFGHFLSKCEDKYLIALIFKNHELFNDNCESYFFFMI